MTDRRRQDLVKHELIGLDVEVVEATDPNQRGVAGRVVDETRNTFLLETDGTEVRIPKAGATFRFDVDEGVIVPGDRLRHRPEDRVKRAR
ncbi:MAG: ribonuclease P protein subunit [Thermoplasmata archaeon]|nr:ribonuclease P protein subunit [Thermoplasmata archaeon]